RRAANDARRREHEARHRLGVGARGSRTGFKNAFQRSRNSAPPLGCPQRSRAQLAQGKTSPFGFGIYSHGSLRSQETSRRYGHSRLAEELTIGNSSRQGAKAPILEEKDKISAMNDREHR